MNAHVITNYVDRVTGELHLEGERVTLTDARAAELSAGGFVRCEQATSTHEMSAAELRARIEGLGGTAPKKATKAKLAEILASIEE